MKTCSKCKLIKEYKDFSRLYCSKDGRQYQCKQCKSNSRFSYIMKNLDQARSKEKAGRTRFNKLNPGRHAELALNYASTPNGRYTKLKSACKKNDRNSNISFEDYITLISDVFCYYCEGPLSTFGHALDRRNHQKGYTLDNVIPCCGPCNRFRGQDLTVEEAKQLITSLKTLRGTEKCPWRNL